MIKGEEQEEEDHELGLLQKHYLFSINVRFKSFITTFGQVDTKMLEC